MSKDFYMDPQKLSNLDPKLREAYQRVMGTPIPQPQDTFSQNQSQTPAPIDPNSGSTPIPDPTPVPTPVTPVPEPEPPSSTINGSIPTPDINPAITPDEPTSPAIQPPPAEPAPASQPPPAITPEPAPKFDRLNSEVAAAPTPQISPNFSTPAPQAQAITIKKKNNLMPILIGVVILVFLVVYALFWVKIFNFKLPFLP